jgi:hypothetical protein
LQTPPLLHHLIRPARGGAAGVVIVFAVLLTVAANAGLLGIPLALILLSWFFKYAYILFDHVVRGFDEPPTLDINMLNPIDEQRPLGQLVIVGILGAAVKLAAGTLPPAAAVLVAAAATLILPASIAVLGVEGNILKAVYPPALYRMIAGLGVSYAVVWGVIACYALGLGFLGRSGLWLPVQLGIGMFAVLSIFSGLAGALYERRDDLGLETWHSPERTAEREREMDSRQNDRVVTEAYGLVRVGAHAKAWEMLQGWLASRHHSSEDYRWLCERVTAWPDPRYAERLTEEFVDRLLAAKRNGEALDVVARRLRDDPTFRPKTPATTLHIARLAVRGGGAPGVARALLSDFGQRFAGHPLVESARALETSTKASARHLGE